ncbi:MAG: high-affinity branched-chain amino acid ABC transporter permease LivM [Alphaproteobacteria bacterium]|jgi:branched-chain amino acid transport system permease protein|nr:high-affinity branched-chain amino acid ABC transporter permease LivM [Alphaproteobacteria bacterium]MDP6622144.1 high-affinity branched-chain amino acid ABC transporter permease LivM [Alphaproteobacteria bacterium]|tara:strand:+ start:602 stop:2137 length:1536 start_codon:yes stop_codon:yes gene_type:complete
MTTVSTPVSAPDPILPPIDARALVKEAGLAALVVIALAIALVGLRTLDVPGRLDIETRFGAVAMAAVVTFFGRLATILLRQRRATPVLFGAGAFSAYLLVLTVASLTLEGEGDTAALAGTLLPFGSMVVNVVLLVVSAAFTARAAFLRWGDVAAKRPAQPGQAAPARLGGLVHKLALYLGPLILILAIALPFAPFADRRLIDIAILVGTYVMLGWGLNIVVGLAGLLDLGYVAFYAVGAYAYALFAQYYGMGFWISLPFAGVMAATAGVVLGFPVLRLRGDYLAIVTLGFGEMIRIILLNWYDFTNGPDGISGIPRPSFFGLPFTRYPAEGSESFHSFFGLEYTPLDRIIFLYYLILVMALVTNFFTMRIRRLPVGRAWEALREDETACRSLGINPRNTKLTAFGIGAMFAGFAGSFFATRQGFISPESFTFIESAVILAIVVLGGMGSQIGVVVAAVLLIGLPEFFRELQQFRMLAFGAAMVLIMIWRPAGLLAHREPTMRLFGKGSGPP